MNDPHGRFGAWLAEGGADEPPRDVALHASACPECMRLASAFDGLLAVDPGAVDAPPAAVRTMGAAPRPAVSRMRAAVGAGAAGLLLGAAVVAGGLLIERRTPPPVAIGTGSPIPEAVLGGQGGAAVPVETATPRPTPARSTRERSAPPSSQPSVEPSAPDGGSEDREPGGLGDDADPPPPVADPSFVFATPAPTVAFLPPIGTPRPSAPTFLPTPRPSAAPTAAPTEPPTAEPTLTPTESPTPQPTPEPTPQPTPEPTGILPTLPPLP